MIRVAGAVAAGIVLALPAAPALAARPDLPDPPRPAVRTVEVQVVSHDRVAEGVQMVAAGAIGAAAAAAWTTRRRRPA
ncbi:hypothetical protein [Paractinoplanes lichenicola]|uniref:Uncharacterized protein n=1 Tax=Paractinoplanes lichenicola TaxID=2802976 RepID=A0ABS1VU98_9ACTN|nr:hypothetical protein [Actinoplanes lichenicola]MBL7258056.1 hypothetical protein [Actinoplanes lichenicola]